MIQNKSRPVLSRFIPETVHTGYGLGLNTIGGMAKDWAPLQRNSAGMADKVLQCDHTIPIAVSGRTATCPTTMPYAVFSSLK